MIRIPHPIKDEPEVILADWRAFRVNAKGKETFHLSGRNTLMKEGRVSSAVATFDKKTMSGTTVSGRLYLLEGDAGYDEDSEWVLSTWLKAQGLDRGHITTVAIEQLPHA